MDHSTDRLSLRALRLRNAMLRRLAARYGMQVFTTEELRQLAPATGLGAAFHFLTARRRIEPLVRAQERPPNWGARAAGFAVGLWWWLNSN